MAHIITSQSDSINYRPSVQKVDFSSVTTYEPRRLPVYKFKANKAEQHRLAKLLIEQHHYKAGIAATLRELINCSSNQGDSRVSQETLAYRLRCTPRTIRNHLAKLEDDGLILYFKNGWKHSNTTILLFVQHLNINKEEKDSCYLTPPDEPQKKGSHTGGRDNEKERANASADARDALQEPDWDDHIEYKPLSDEEIVYNKQKMAELRKMLRLN